MMGWRAVKHLWHHHGTEGSVHQRSRSVWLIIKVIYLMTVVQNDLAWWRFCVSIWKNAFAPAANALECESTLSNGVAKLLLLTNTGDFGGRRSTVQLHRYVRPTWAALLGGWGEAQNLAMFLVCLWEVCCNPRPCWHCLRRNQHSDTQGSGGLALQHQQNRAGLFCQCVSTTMIT